MWLRGSSLLYLRLLRDKQLHALVEEGLLLLEQFLLLLLLQLLHLLQLICRYARNLDRLQKLRILLLREHIGFLLCLLVELLLQRCQSDLQCVASRRLKLGLQLLMLLLRLLLSQLLEQRLLLFQVQ